MRLIELSFPDTVDTKPLLKSCLRANPVDHRLEPADDRGRRVLRLYFKTGDGQEAIDAIQGLLADIDDWRLVVIPIEATLPKIEAEEDAETSRKRRTLALREELFEDIAAGAKLNRDFLVLTALSAVVAALGLNANNVAAVIGATFSCSGSCVSWAWLVARTTRPATRKLANCGTFCDKLVECSEGASRPVCISDCNVIANSLSLVSQQCLAGFAAARACVSGLSCEEREA